jgi:hypothetical protein
MIREALEYLFELQAPKVVEVDPKDIDEKVVRVQGGYVNLEPPQIDTMQLANLESMVEFSVRHVPVTEGFFVVSLSGDVELWSYPHPRTKERDRWAYCKLSMIGALTQCGEQGNPGWLRAEAMIPMLLTEFEDSDERKTLLKILGNVTDGVVHTYEDDGVGQQVTTKRGVSMKGLSELPSPLYLIPRATYPELVNSSQQYIVRAEGGSETSPPTFLLKRVFDPVFEHVRRQSIVEYLKSNAGLPVI